MVATGHAVVDYDEPEETPGLGSDAFETWYRTYSPGLKSTCMRLLRDEGAAQDVVQETLLRAWTRRTHFQSEAQIAPWLWCVARNLCTDILRRRNKIVFSDTLPEAPDFSSDPALPVEREQERIAVRHAMSALSDRHREVLYLRDVKGVAYEELASKLGVTADGARAVLFRARRSLRAALESSGQFIGALFPTDTIRRFAEAARQIGQVVAERSSVRPGSAVGAVAAVMAALGILGAQHHATAPVTPSVPPALAAAAAPAQAATDGSLVPQIPGAPSVAVPVSAQDATAPQVPNGVQDPALGGWSLSLRVGGVNGNLDTGTGVMVGVATAGLPEPIVGLVSMLPSLDINLLPAPASPSPGASAPVGK